MSPKLPVITPKELIRALERDGFIQERQVGSHVTLFHPTRKVVAVVPFHNRDMKKGLLKNILNGAELEVEDLIRLLRK